VGFCTDLMDINAGRMAGGPATIDSAGWELFHFMLEGAQRAQENLG
jgi:galactarate dehydratase